MMRLEDEDVRFFLLVGRPSAPKTVPKTVAYVVTKEELDASDRLSPCEIEAVCFDGDATFEPIPILAGHCCVFSTLLLIGGGPSKLIWYLNTERPPSPGPSSDNCWAWDLGGEMTHNRQLPKVFTYHGEMYIFGGWGCSSRQSWIEIYDLEKGSYFCGNAPEDVLVLQEQPSSCFFWDSTGTTDWPGASECRKKPLVVVCFRYDYKASRLLSYDVENNRWENFDLSFPPCPPKDEYEDLRSRNLIPYRNTLFIIDYANVWSVYDLPSRKVVEEMQVGGLGNDDRQVIKTFCHPGSHESIIFTLFMRRSSRRNDVSYAKVRVRGDEKGFIAELEHEGIITLDFYENCTISAYQPLMARRQGNVPGVIINTSKEMLGVKVKVRFEKECEFIQKGITKLKNCLERLPKTQFSSKDFRMIYDSIYKICTQKPLCDYPQQLHDKYKESFEEYIISTVLPSLREKHDKFMLRELDKRCSNHKVMVTLLSACFSYLDRCRIIGQRPLTPLKEVGVSCFRDLVYQEIHSQVKDAVISLIDQEREGEQIDRALLKNVLEIFVEIGMGQLSYYENDFEASMSDDTSAYYSRKASSWILEDSCPDYMLKAEKCLNREKDRVSYYMHSSSARKLLERAQNELLAVHAYQLLEKEHSGCHALLRDDKAEDLSRMFRLFSKIPNGLDLVAYMFKQHVTAEGTALVKQAEDAASNKKILLIEKKDVSGLHKQVFVRKIIELHDKYLAHVNDCFQNHTLFHEALKEAFEIFCNKAVAGSLSAELLASFCDHILKKGSGEKLSDEAIEETLEKVVKLLAYISDKDLFAEFYRKELARRLLFDKSANDDHERSILKKLKQLCGSQFTNKMEGMVTDFTLARENQANFEDYLSNNPNANPGIDLTVTVLNSRFWPSYKPLDLNLPKEMVRCVEVFKEFYQTKTEGRKLSWIYSLGTCTIIGKFEAKPVELIVTTHQAAALLLFNSSDRLSYSEIMTRLNLSDDDAARLLHSLSCATYKILNKEPSTETISPTDHFEFNSKFTDKMRRIKIPLPPVVEKKKKVIEDVVTDRRYAIDASIVRIMKSRKVLGYKQLVKECVEQLRGMFKPDLKAIKKRIESLIDREYLERDEENPSTFRYIA